jgi:hypothetical protein
MLIDECIAAPILIPCALAPVILACFRFAAYPEDGKEEFDSCFLPNNFLLRVGFFTLVVIDFRLESDA